MLLINDLPDVIYILSVTKRFPVILSPTDSPCASELKNGKFRSPVRSYTHAARPATLDPTPRSSTSSLKRSPKQSHTLCVYFAAISCYSVSNSA